MKMSKRRRTSSLASRGLDDDSLDSPEASTSSGPTMRKRKKQSDPMEVCNQIYEMLRNHKKTDGSLVCDTFIRAPKRRQEPSYYNVVSNPMDLLKVQQKLRTDEYLTFDDFEKDIELIVNNTKAFYKRNSPEYKDAVELWDFFNTTKKKLLHIEDVVKEKHPIKRPTPVNNRLSRTPVAKKSPAPVKNNLNNHTPINVLNFSDEENEQMYEELFNAVMTATDDSKKLLYPAFQLLPSKKKYPEYYEVIEQPIDLKRIAIKIQTGEYISILGLERDLLLMCKNACLFNEPSSAIYKNAKLLKKIIQNKRIEILEQHSKPIKNNASPNLNKLKEKPKKTRKSINAVSRLKDQDSDLEDGDILKQTENEITLITKVTNNVDQTPVDPSDPKWKLFECVTSVNGPDGVPLAEPFWKLPSRRFYPDYYREIKNPMSLAQIKKKLISKLYGTVSEVAGDMTIMFENAKKYNIPDSKLYRDAVRLQKIMQAKVQELLDIDQVTQRVTNKHRKAFEEYGIPIRRKPGPKPKDRPPGTPPAQRGRPPKDSIPLKKRLHTLAKYMLDFTCEDGRKPMLAFMEKPSKKLYADYYEVIAEPIDFLEIEAKIKAEQYSCEKDMIKDFLLMFSNCREFNEENSPIYEDAQMLEKHLMDKVARIMNSPDKSEAKKDKNHTPRTYKPRKQATPLEKMLKTLYDAVRDYRDPKGDRQLSLIFQKLPSKLDYPDYYEVIKNPMDIERISQKMKNNGYESLDDLATDFMLVFDNACKFNEPDSQIYKDALVLQRVTLQTKLQIKENEDRVPDVATAIQNILLNLFTSVYNHSDEEGRCYVDSMSDLPEHEEVDGKKIRALSLDLLKRRLDRGVYKRLDTFQEDFFACMERARKLSRTDSQVFEDSVELQLYFIKLRDELCRKGELLQSPALNYTINDAKSAIETVRHSKQLQESLEEETETRSSEDSIIKDEKNMNIGESMTCNQRTFQVGEFVYMDAKEKGCEPHILMIERLFEKNGKQMMQGNHYLRPAETYHISTRKFLEKEVFKSDSHVTVPLEDIKERCCVVSVKQYFTMKPEGYDEKDIYVSESRYSVRHRAFKKIKIFPELPIKLVPREKPLEPKRVMSVFRERVEKHKDELAELQEREQLVEKEKPNVVAHATMEIEDGNTYYEQYNTMCSGVVKTGDYVYVVADGGRQVIAQIDSIWDTKDGKCYFRGPWFIFPTDIPYTPNKLYYKSEVLLSTLDDVNPLVTIVGKCSVLEFSDYITYRHTEIPETDTFICATTYDEINRQMKKLPPEGLKKYRHRSEVTQDEIYYFPKPLNPPKMDIFAKKEVKRKNGKLYFDLDEKTVKNKIVTGYILYSREIRKQVVASNPESTFGDISRIVGTEWKSLPTSEKQLWEERATRLNEETKAALLAEEQCASPAPPPENQVFECLWDNCDYQFEDLSDCIEHTVKDSKESQCHVQAYLAERPGTELHCRWRGCARNGKKNVQPFPNITRLIRHVRDMHINKGNGRSVPPENRTKNFRASSRISAASRPTPSATPNPPAVTTSAVTSVAAQKPPEPMFISVPPRPQRVLHSEAYIKYIEGLQSEQRFISQWEKTLNATPENTPPPDPEKLAHVATWLGKRADQHDNVVAALWSLRNQLMKDTLCLHKTL